MEMQRYDAHCDARGNATDLHRGAAIGQAPTKNRRAGKREENDELGNARLWQGGESPGSGYESKRGGLAQNGDDWPRRRSEKGGSAAG